jgi:hypothetical protein
MRELATLSFELLEYNQETKFDGKPKMTTGCKV